MGLSEGSREREVVVGCLGVPSGAAKSVKFKEEAESGVV